MKPIKDKPILNFMKMKWERYPLVITVFGMFLIATITFLSMCVYNLILILI